MYGNVRVQIGPVPRTAFADSIMLVGLGKRHLAVGFLLLFAIAVACPNAYAQTNPIPLINQPLVPAIAVPGGPGFTLTVNGTGYVASAVVNWNGSARATTFVNASQLTAAIVASDIATASTASITVLNPGPGGGLSNIAYFDITNPVSTPTFATLNTNGAPNVLPGAVVVADFNGDGKLDLAIAQGLSPVSILLGNGDGTFKPHVDYAVGSNPISLVVGDFNGDGKFDLAVANTGDDTVSILMGNGDGTFQQQRIVSVAQTSGAPTYPISVVVGDFNGDGKLDLAVALSDSLTVAILLGNGDGTFQNQVIYSAAPIGSVPTGIATGDFNRDGKLDLAVSSGGGVSIFQGNGDGTFKVPSIQIGGGEGVIAVDINKDGVLDLIFPTDIGPSSGVSILLGNGDGTFRTGGSYITGSATLDVALGDFNADGNLDLAVPVPDSRAVYLFLGNEDGTFQSPIQLVTGMGSASSANNLAVGDFNGDGKLDMAVPSDSPSLTSLTMLLQGQIPALSVSTSILDFAQQANGTTSPPQAVMLTDSGTSTLSFSGIAVSGGNAGDFSQINTCSSTLAAGANCQITVTFTPTGVGVRTALITISDDSAGSPQAVSLSGTGFAPAVVSPLSLSFSNQPEGATSVSQNVTFTNNESIALSITSIAISGTDPSDFAQANTCGTAVAAGASCTIGVTFTPAATGTRSASLVIANSAFGSPETVSLTGNGTGPIASVSPPTVTFTNQYVGTSGLPQSVTVMNNGGAALNITGVTTNSADFGSFSSCGNSLPAGSSCAIAIFFDPTVGGSRTGILTITDNAPASPQTVSLNGTGQDFSLAPATPAPTTISAGQTANLAVAVSPAGGFNQPIALACSGGPAMSTCAVSPSSIKLNGSSASMVNVTLTTKAGLPPAISPPVRSGYRPLYLIIELLGLSLFTGWFGWHKNRSPRLAYRLVLLLFLCAGVMMSACGSVVSSGGGGGNQGTPTGTYALTVTGTFSTGSTTLTHNSTLTLVVQ